MITNRGRISIPPRGTAEKLPRLVCCFPNELRLCPDLEQAWHAWYSGPKLAEMMTHPLFLSGQRYRASGLDQRVIYLAAWVVESPAAFETPQYRASWGFADWAPHITDWSRNLFRGPESDVSDLLEDLRAKRPDVLWMPVVGLDRSCPAIGLRRLAAGAEAARLPDTLAAGIRQTVYTPITPRRRAA